MTDFMIYRLNQFSATSVTVIPQTSEAREAFQAWLGAGATSAEIRKSDVSELIDAIETGQFTYSSDD
jgi:hypothetical protein